MEQTAWAGGARATLDRLVPGNEPIDLGTADAVAATFETQAWTMVRSGNGAALLRALIRLSRLGAQSLTVILADGLPALIGPVSVGDLRRALVTAAPPADLLYLEGGQLMEVPNTGRLVPVSGAEASAELEEMIGGLPLDRDLLEVATYFDGTFLEYQGVPVVGIRDGEVVVGVDRRDQEMMAQAEPSAAGRLAAAGPLLELVIAARNGRLGRHDLSDFAVGRRLRYQAMTASQAMIPLEISDSGGPGDRAYALEGDDLWCFGRGTDPYLAVEGLVVGSAMVGVGRICFSTSSGPHPSLQELAGIFGTGKVLKFVEGAHAG